MIRFLADETTPGEAVSAARGAGFDVAWIAEFDPGADDEVVLSRAVSDDRVLITFDKDFGELVFRHGRAGSPGIILLRQRLRSPGAAADFLVLVLSQSITWAGHFCVAREGSLRVIALL